MSEAETLDRLETLHDVDRLLRLSTEAIACGDGAGARVLLTRACALAADHAPAWHMFGLALLLTGDAADAEAAFAEAQSLAPNVLAHALLRVQAALAANQANATLARLEAEAAENPLDPVTQTARAVLLERIGRRMEAIAALEIATALAPDAAVPMAMLGGLLARCHRGKEADQALAAAIALDPTNLQLRNDRATVLMRLHRHAEAERLLVDVIAQAGDDVTALCNLSTVTTSLGRQDEAVAIAHRAITLAPDEHLPRRALCNALPYQASIDGVGILDALTECSSRLPRQTAHFTNTPDPYRKLRVGLLSGSLRTHPVGWLTVAGFETLDPTQFELVCLGHDAAPDPIALRYGAIASGWFPTDGLDDRALHDLTHALGVDLLIDMGGYGDSGRMPACALRLAPVQIKWVGMQNHSTGLAEMDWFLTDCWETPQGSEQFYSERLLRLQDGYVCYSPPPHAPDPVPLPALRNGYVTFGCFNNLAKITPLVIQTWCVILRQIPNAQLVLKTHQFSDAETREWLVERFAAHGISPERITLQGASAHRAFLGEYNKIDLVLDPFPYSGGLTTCEALWMGVPTLTLPGETFASRHSLSHMSNVGLTDWITNDPDDYIERALDKATDIDALATLRAGLRERVKASPLCDAPRFGRNLGAALRQTWHDWCLNGAHA